MNPAEFLSYIQALPSYEGQIVHLEKLPPTPASYESLARRLHPSLQSGLNSLGYSRLYSHQAEAINTLTQGQNVIVSTTTASGKTLCYNIPVINTLLEEKSGCALYLFPTKALAQDQMSGLGELADACNFKLKYATFDGDTPYHERSDIKRSAQIILTNPDMLHLGILPNHRSWSRLLRRLRYVVVDEAHVYRGVFGSHVANVLRRLRRICALYGSRPQFICCSATIANPGEHAERLVGLPFCVINQDGAPHGAKDFALWNPPIIDEAKSTRRSTNSEATFLLKELVRHGIRTLTFVRTRRLAELVYLYAKEQLLGSDRSLAGLISPYRAGYLPEERRQIERRLFEGDLLGVVSTTALELGVDIGDLGATVLTGYPGSIASTWQQAGRSGRGEEPSLSILVGMDNPLDQYFMRHPEAFFGRSHEHALINPSNPHIIGPHLLCAAYEMPLTPGDRDIFPGFDDSIPELEAQRWLREHNNRWFLVPTASYPAQDINIRSTTSQYYTVLDTSRGNRLLATVESSTAFFEIHPGAIYLHQGESYLITDLDLVSHTAYAAPTEVTHYTQAKDLTDLRVLRSFKDKVVGSVRVSLGWVEVTTTVYGFKKKRQYTEEVIGEEPLDLPPQSFETVALWFDVPEKYVNDLRSKGLDAAGGLHATEHAAIALLPLFALCDRNDIGGLSALVHADTDGAVIFIYDGHPGGIGIAEKGYELIEDLWRATLRAVSECPCEEGCPSCIQSPKCGNNNEPLDKRAAIEILNGLLAGLPPHPGLQPFE